MSFLQTTLDPYLIRRGRPKKKLGEVYYRYPVLVTDEFYFKLKAQQRPHEPMGALVDRLLEVIE